ncbi:MAG: hypothetical protein MUO40_02390 [Anaerolineaceae bacterium]|nr:hypothetical protein [Anaerolineaceae bacterium]
MNLALSLFRLQKLDTQISRIKTRLLEIDLILTDDRTIQEAKSTFEQTQINLKASQKALRNIEDQVNSQKIKLNLTQNTLFGGKVNNPKELQDLEQESNALKRYISKLEDDQLNCMILLEDSQRETQAAEKYLNQSIGNKASENAGLAGEKIQLESELPGIFSQREAIQAGITTDIQELYDNLLISKNGLAVVEVIDTSCGACGANLTPADLQSARSPSSLLKCQNCGRLLYKS